MAAVDLPENVDDQFADDANDPSVKLHQQWHGIYNRLVNYFDLDTKRPSVGDGLIFNGTKFVPQPVVAIPAALPTSTAYVIYDPTRGFVFSTTAPSTGGGTTTPTNPSTGGGTTTPTTGTKPNKPTNVVATANGPASVAVTWTPSSTDTVIGHRVFLNGKQVGGDLGATANSYLFNQATPNTAYSPTVVAFTSDNTSDTAAGVAVTTPAGAATYDSNGLGSTGVSLQSSAYSDADTITATAQVNYDPNRSSQQTLELLGMDVREVNPTTKAVISADNGDLDFKPAAGQQSTSTWGVERRMPLTGTTKLPGGTTAAPKMYRTQVYYKIVGQGAYPRIGPPIYFTVTAGAPATGGNTGTGGGTGTGGTVGPTGPNAGKRGIIPAVPAKGWFSGGAGVGIDSGATAFGTWRGRPVECLMHWADAYDGTVWSWPGLKSGGPAYNFKGLLALAIGGPKDWAAGARGDFDAKLRTALTELKSLRTIGGVAYPTCINPAHEFNGNWFAWGVGSSEVVNYKATMRRWRQIQLDVYPQAMWWMTTNKDTSGQDIDWRNCWEDLMPDGKTPVWDGYGNDNYNQFPTTTSYAGFAANSKIVDSYGAPKGVEAHRAFAQAKGVPFALFEWAGNADTGDQEGWMQAHYDWMKANRGNGPGNMFADFYFNQTKDGTRWQLYTATRQPKVAAAYRQRYTAG